MQECKIVCYDSGEMHDIYWKLITQVRIPAPTRCDYGQATNPVLLFLHFKKGDNNRARIRPSRNVIYMRGSTRWNLLKCPSKLCWASWIWMFFSFLFSLFCEVVLVSLQLIEHNDSQISNAMQNQAFSPRVMGSHGRLWGRGWGWKEGKCTQESFQM